MIKSNNGEVQIDGNRIDLIYDFHQILGAMIKGTPDIVAMAVTLRQDEILEAFADTPVCKDGNLMTAIEEIHKLAIACLKENMG